MTPHNEPTPTILLYILDGLDDLTTVLFSHYFIIDHCAPLPMRSIGPSGMRGGNTHGPCYQP